jgi:hypothetical protein
VVDGVGYGSPIGNLAAATKDAGLTKVDAWIGTGGSAVAQLVVPVIHPKVYLPSHWDGLFNSFWAGMPYPFKDEALQLPQSAKRRVCPAGPILRQVHPDARRYGRWTRTTQSKASSASRTRNRLPSPCSMR